MNKHNLPKIRMRETLVSYAFLAPALLFFCVFVIYPMLSGIFTSLFDYTLKKFEFVGLQNYINLFQDEIFWKSLKNTLVIVVGSVPIVVIFSLFVGVTIYQKKSGVRSFFRGVFYLPVVTGTVAVTVVWKWIYDPLNGILNYVLQSGGVIEEPIMWLGDKRFAIWAIIIILLTTSVGQPIILYVAALGNIPQS
ncbi:MAG: sugar ABC transporter permease, partial [Niameybacter sp.]